MKTLRLLPLLFLAFVLTISGVYAAWIYPNSMIEQKNNTLGIILSEFVWEPEEILPVTPGSNYMVLLDSILNNSKGGLNSSKGTVENAVKQDGIIHSSQNVHGGNLKLLFITEECRELEFIIKYISDTEFHVYMFENKDVTSGLVNVTQIYAYMTVLTVVDGEWIGLESQLGYSTLRYVRNTNYIAIDPDEWIRGNLTV